MEIKFNEICLFNAFMNGNAPSELHSIVRVLCFFSSLKIFIPLKCFLCQFHFEIEMTIKFVSKLKEALNLN